MIPTAPTPTALPPGAAAQGALPRLSPTGAEPPAAPRPELARVAVTQADELRAAALDPSPDPGPPPATTLARLPVPEIPPDPPPVKGLGIPPLDTAMVGDLDEIETPPPPPGEPPGAAAISDLLAALQDPTPPGLDLRA